MSATKQESQAIEVDLLSIGSGGGGLCAAITAHDHGATALVIERSTQIGGVTAYSMGELWIPGNHHAAAAGIKDSVESGFHYVKSLSLGYGSDDAILNQCIHGPVALKYFEDRIGMKMLLIRDLCDYYYPANKDGLAEGRYLEVAPFPATSLGEWQTKTRVSPHVPYGLTHEDIFHGGGMANMMSWNFGLMSERLTRDERCAGPGLAASYVKGVLDRKIPIMTGVQIEQLIVEHNRVVGARGTKDGKDISIKAKRGVVVAVSSYERRPDYAKTLSHQLEPVSMVMTTVDGAHLRLAGSIGARISRVPDATMLGFHVPGEEQEEGVPLWRGALPFLGLPHTIVVNGAGKRFSDESFYRSVYFALDSIDAGTQTHPNFPCWVVFDSQARAKYPFGSAMPGQELPEGLGVKADTIEELARKSGIDVNGMKGTVASFNGYCESGVDPEFKRGTHPWGAFMTGDASMKPNPNMGPLVKPPFYAVKLSRMAGGGITSTGLMVDEHCRVMGWNDQPIEGLYAAGNSVARMDNGALMQSGITNARGMTHGYLAGRHAAGKPSELLAKEKARLKW